MGLHGVETFPNRAEPEANNHEKYEIHENFPIGLMQDDETSKISPRKALVKITSCVSPAQFVFRVFRLFRG